MFNELTLFILGAGFNLAVALLVVRFIYYPVTQDKNYVFTFLAFSTIIYFVLGLFTRTDLSVGVGFGLFAIFSVLRYRTDEMPIREMTYLFIIIALPVMNSIFMSNGDLLQLLLANGVIVGLLYVLEREWGFHFEESKKITYERIDLIVPARRDELLTDLRERSGLPIKRVEIGRLDFLRDIAEMRVYYDEPRRRARVIEPGAEASESQAHHLAKRIISRPCLEARDSSPHEPDALAGPGPYQGRASSFSAALRRFGHRIGCEVVKPPKIDLAKGLLSNLRKVRLENDEPLYQTKSS